MEETTSLYENSTVTNGNVSIVDNVTDAAIDSPVGGAGFKGIQDAFYIAGYIITPTFLIVGLFGNVLTIITMSSRAFSNMTSRYILIALAISDATLLLTQPFNKQFVIKMIGYDVRALSDVGCKAFFHIFKTGKMTSSWLIVILCFERFIAVVFPFKTKTIITKTSIISLIVIDYVFIGTFNAVWTFSSIIVNGVCKPDVTTPETKNRYRDFLLAGSSFYSLIPMIIMAMLTPVIVLKLLRQRNKRKQMVGRGGASSEKANSDTIRISAMLIGVVVAYVAFILPITVVHNLAFWRNVSAFDTNTLEFFVLREVAQILEQLNYSTNFILYVLCSEKFRKRASEILRLNRCMSGLRPVQTASSKTRSTNLKASKIMSNSASTGPEPNDVTGLDGVIEEGDQSKNQQAIKTVLNE